MSSWENSVLDLPEFLSLLTCWLEVLMSNKFLWLSIMIYPQTEKITFTGNCPKKKNFAQNRTSIGILNHFFQIHDEKPDPITEISVDILQLFTLWWKNSNFCYLFGNSQYIHTNLTYIFFKFSESAVVVALAVKALPSILLLTRINVLCTILKNSTTLVSMRCPWMWPTSSKKKRKEVFFVKSISRIFVKKWFHEKKILSTTIPSTLLIVYPMLTLVEVVACLLARFGVVFCSKAGLSIQVQYTPISRSEVLCYDFVHRKETDRFWSHCKSSSRIVVNKNKLVCWPALKMIFSLFLCFPCAASFICAVCLKITDMPPVQFQNWISKYYVGTSFNSGQNWRKSY